MLGLGLGALTPANSTLVMSTVPCHAAGTAFGVAAVTLVLHLVPGTRPQTMTATGLLALVAVGVCGTNVLRQYASTHDYASDAPLEL